MLTAITWAFYYHFISIGSYLFKVRYWLYDFHFCVAVFIVLLIWYDFISITLNVIVSKLWQHTSHLFHELKWLGCQLDWKLHFQAHVKLDDHGCYQDIWQSFLVLFRKIGKLQDVIDIQFGIITFIIGEHTKLTMKIKYVIVSFVYLFIHTTYL